MLEISKEQLLQYYRDLEDGFNILQEKFHQALKENEQQKAMYCELFKLLLQESPETLKKILPQINNYNGGALLLMMLNPEERRLLFNIMKEANLCK